MTCKECNCEITVDDTTVNVNTTDIEFIIECPECGKTSGTFITNADLTEFD